MLAADDEHASLDALRFSLASDIVELVVLTGDEAFLQTLREAVGGARRLWHVLSPDKVSDLLIAGDVGILVLDVLVLHEAPAIFISQIKRQFPDLVVVVAGNRDCESALAGLISKGLVYRFIHKPMSPGRAKLFAEAAVKKYEETRKLAPTVPSITRQSRSNRGLMIGAVIGAVGLVAIIFWTIHKNAADDAAPPPAAADRSAPAAQAQKPAEASPVTGLEERFDEAGAAMEAARQAVQPKAGARSDVKAREARKPPPPDVPAQHAQTPAAADSDAARDALEAARRQAQTDAAAQLINSADEHLQQDRHIEPASDSTRHDPDGAAAAQAFLANVVAAGSLTLIKSVQPRYPKKAELHRTEGWVELDFTVTETGTVKDLAVHAASAPGAFEDEAIGALSKWRYQPVVRDGKAMAQRARIRFRFALTG